MAKNEERWRELCALAAVEQDPKKLMDLVREITRLLELRDGQRSRQGDPAGNTGPDTKQTAGG